MSETSDGGRWSVRAGDAVLGRAAAAVGERSDGGAAAAAHARYGSVTTILHATFLLPETACSVTRARPGAATGSANASRGGGGAGSHELMRTLAACTSEATRTPALVGRCDGGRRSCCTGSRVSAAEDGRASLPADDEACSGCEGRRSSPSSCALKAARDA